MKRYFWLVVPLALAMLFGCGGGSRPSTGRVTVTVVWPEKTRLIPEATESIRLRLLGPGDFYSEVVLRRNEGQTEATQGWGGLQPGYYTLFADAYAHESGSGTPLASGSSGVGVESGVNKQVVIVMNSTIRRMEVTPTESTIRVGGTVQLTATAYDAENRVVLLTPAKLTWSVGQPSLMSVDQSGLVTGIQPGAGSVTVRDTETGNTASATVTVATAGSPRFYMTKEAEGWSVLVSTEDPWTKPQTLTDFVGTAVSVAVDPQGRIYMADQTLGRIIRMDDGLGGGKIGYGGRGSGVGQFNNPSDVFIDEQGRILIADTGNGRIVRINDMTGAGWVEYQAFEQPVSVCTDTFGRIYVADAAMGIVRMDDIHGTKLAVAPLTGIRAVRVSPTGPIYALQDTGEEHVLNRLDNVPPSSPVSRRVPDGRRLAVDSQGRIYLTRTDGILQRFDGSDWSNTSQVPVSFAPYRLWGIAIYEPPAP